MVLAPSLLFSLHPSAPLPLVPSDLSFLLSTLFISLSLSPSLFCLPTFLYRARSLPGILIPETSLYRNYHFYPSFLAPLPHYSYYCQPTYPVHPPVSCPVWPSHRNSLKSREYSRVTRGLLFSREREDPFFHPVRKKKIQRGGPTGSRSLRRRGRENLSPVSDRRR